MGSGSILKDPENLVTEKIETGTLASIMLSLPVPSVA